MGLIWLIASVEALCPNHRNPFLFQHPDQPDQRQADQGIGVATFEFLKQCDAESFRFKRTGTVIRLFPL